MSGFNLPPLDGFTRDELVELIRILHGGLVRAQSDYELLASTAARAVEVLQALATPEPDPSQTVRSLRLVEP